MKELETYNNIERLSRELERELFQLQQLTLDDPRLRKTPNILANRLLVIENLKDSVASNLKEVYMLEQHSKPTDH